MSESSSAAPLRRTPLHGVHVAEGAKLVPFAGWEMPVQYAGGIRAEHHHVRLRAGLFDVSHMGQIETTGPQATEFLQRVLTNDLAKLEAGGAQYALICADDGGVVDDVFTYRLGPRRYLTVTNAANHVADFAWLAERAGEFDVEVTDRANEFAMIALQGPRARAILERLIEGEAPARLRVGEARVGGHAAIVCGTGYTGEDGVELLLSPDDAPTVWEELKMLGAEPVGLGARDTLRLEVCYPLYGNELSREHNPLEAGLDWAVALDTGFIGAVALKKIASAGGPERLLAPFVFLGPGIPRQGNPVVRGGDDVGVVTSGTLSPSLDTGIGMAYVQRRFAEPGTELEVDVRGTLRRAQVRKRPLYAKPQ